MASTDNTPSARGAGDTVDLGFVANGLAEVGARVDVLTIFDNSVYLTVAGAGGRGLICLGSTSIDRGPFTIRLKSHPTEPLPRALGLDARPQGGEIVRRNGVRGIQLQGVPFVALDHVPVWTPPPAPSWTAETLQPGRAALETLMLNAIEAKGADDPGLAPLVFGEGSGAVSRRRTATLASARPLVGTLRQHLPDVIRTGQIPAPCAEAMTFLVGLGPGLTPSGDDLLGGLFIALTALGAEQTRDQLWAVVADEINDLTNEISAMHLAVAADGFGGASVHELVAALIKGDKNHLRPCLDTVAAIGHSSGLDTVAGLALAIDGWLTAAAQRVGSP